jgi:uncharacterized protein
MSIRGRTRCSAITTRGRRCGRTTVVYPKMCYQHFQAIHGLKIAQSTIPNAGLGLFTTRTIKPHTKIADYTGVIMTNTEYRSGSSNYGITYDENHVLDSQNTQSGIARYANDCRKTDQQSGFCCCNNAEIVQTKDNNIILESKDSVIATGHEIFTSYGITYWQDSL